MNATPIFSLECVTFAYPERPPLFRDLRLALHDHDRIGLHGPNGSGKTTLFRLIMGLESPQSGAVLFRGEPVADEKALRRLRRCVGFVMQNSDDQLFSATVLEDVAFGPLNLGLKRGEARDRAMEALEEVGAADLADRATHRLSVGEKKMAAIASVLSMRPQALLLDEPTAALDGESRDRVAAVLNRRKLPGIVVSHDADFLGRVASTIMHIAGDGGVAPGVEQFS